jgi:micrococcal nuclease
MGLIGIVLATSWVAGCRAASTPAARLEHGVVAHVTDGDTLRLIDGRRIRLVQIDAPELDADCFGRAARRALVRLAPQGTRVSLERDPALDAIDAYGRLLRYVVVGEREVNLELVAGGAAQPYFFHGDRGRIARALLAAARRARARHRGLWGACRGARLEPELGAITGPA